jgi:hypothetical protein
MRDLGPEGFSEWQAERGRERQKGLREQMGPEAYSNYQRMLALWRWHPEMFASEPKFSSRIADLDIPRTLAVDLDGTILQYDGFKGVGIFGEPIDGARETLSRLKDDGWFIVVDTCRGEVPQIVEHLVIHGIPFDSVNTHPFQPATANPGKPMAEYRIDDTAIHFNGSWNDIYNEIKRRDGVNRHASIRVSQFAYDPKHNVLIDFVDPFGHRTQPTDYRDPVYWGYPEDLRRVRKRRRELDKLRKQEFEDEPVFVGVDE